MSTHAEIQPASRDQPYVRRPLQDSVTAARPTPAPARRIDPAEEAMQQNPNLSPPIHINA